MNEDELIASPRKDHERVASFLNEGTKTDFKEKKDDMKG